MRILHLTTVDHRNTLAAISQLAHLQRAGDHQVTVTDVLRYRVTDARDGDRFDVVHLHAAAPGLIPTRLGASSADAPALLTLHSYVERKSAEQQQIDVAVLNRFRRITVSSRTIQDRLIAAGVSGDRLRLVPDGVDPVVDPLGGITSSDADVDTVRHIRRIGGRVVGCVGERQSVRLVLEALALLPNTARPICVFVSEGDLSGVRGLAECLGIGAHVLCFGYRTNHRAFTRECDWLLQPSGSAGLSRPAIEAFCDRVPVLGADGAELVELLRESHAGRLFRAGDSQALASSLAEAFAMSDDDRFALCDRAHALYRERFRSHVMVGRYLAEYVDLLTDWATHSSLRPAA